LTSEKRLNPQQLQRRLYIHLIKWQ